jgi:hypothetical protein
LSVREIAVRMGVGRSTASAWLADPDLAKQRARRLRYGRACVECGALTDGSSGAAKAPELCADCSATQSSRKARERSVREIRRFAAMYGRPPSAVDWSPAMARAKCSPARAGEIEERYARDGWPPAKQVQHAFGSWNAGIRAAGFEPLAVGQRRGEAA